MCIIAETVGTSKDCVEQEKTVSAVGAAFDQSRSANLLLRIQKLFYRLESWYSPFCNIIKMIKYLEKIKMVTTLPYVGHWPIQQRITEKQPQLPKCSSITTTLRRHYGQIGRKRTAAPSTVCSRFVPVRFHATKIYFADLQNTYLSDGLKKSAGSEVSNVDSVEMQSLFVFFL